MEAPLIFAPTVQGRETKSLHKFCNNCKKLAMKLVLLMIMFFLQIYKPKDVNFAKKICLFSDNKNNCMYTHIDEYNMIKSCQMHSGDSLSPILTFKQLVPFSQLSQSHFMLLFFYLNQLRIDFFSFSDTIFSYY